MKSSTERSGVDGRAFSWRRPGRVVSLSAVMVTIVCTFVCMLSFQAMADLLDDVELEPVMIPYNGMLLMDGEPLTATGQWLKFELLDNSPGDGQEPDEVVYSQTMQVDVYNGRFAALLGPFGEDESGLHRVLSRADHYLLQTTILGEHNPDDPASTASDDVVLSNPQRLLMSPHAEWAEGATNFNAETVYVQGHVVVGGVLNVQSGLNTVNFNATNSSMNRLTVYTSISQRVIGHEEVSIGPFVVGDFADSDAPYDNGEPVDRALAGSRGHLGPASDELTGWNPASAYKNRGVDSSWSGESLCFLQGSGFSVQHVGASHTNAAQEIYEGFSAGCRVSPTLFGGQREHTSSPLAAVGAHCTSRCLSW